MKVQTSGEKIQIQKQILVLLRNSSVTEGWMDPRYWIKNIKYTLSYLSMKDLLFNH